jgi:hypothetical protein
MLKGFAQDIQSSGVHALLLVPIPAILGNQILQGAFIYLRPITHVNRKRSAMWFLFIYRSKRRWLGRDDAIDMIGEMRDQVSVSSAFCIAINCGTRTPLFDFTSLG